MDDLTQGDICRVCRCEGLPDRQLFHPCICTGSIKWIHQECLMQWMRYSRKEYCELCGHRFSFQPIYSPDMPRVLPLRDVAGGLISSVATAVKYWLHYTLVAIAWLGVVPLTAYRTYRFLFFGSFDSLLYLPFDMLSTENIATGIFRGCFVVTCTLFSFIGLVWLREQILHGGGPDWLEHEDNAIQQEDDDALPIDNANAANAPAAGGGGAAGAEPVAGRGIAAMEAELAMRINQLRLVRREQIHNVNNNNNNNRHQDQNNNERDIENTVMNNDNEDLPEEHVPIDPTAPPPAGPSSAAASSSSVPPSTNAQPAASSSTAASQQQQPTPPPPDEEVHVIRPAVNNNAQEQNVGDGNNVVDGVGGDGDAEPPAVAGEEPNWNPMEWDRAAEELTWERLLGLDGSMVFLEHVFWVVSLNTIFIFIFAFCPFYIGYCFISILEIFNSAGKLLLHFHGLLTTLIGYCLVGLILVGLHGFAHLLKWRQPRRWLGLCYIVVKVTLLSVVEIGVLPLVCGWWLDICSLPMFDATLKDRKATFKAAPGTSLFMHWMFGMVFVYYFASFIVLLREVVRPGVLWFLRNMNDPDYSPIQEMIHLSIMRHIRRLIASAIIFGTTVLLMLWLPIHILKTFWPTFLPYTLSGDSEVNELSLQLLLLQIILPGFFEQSQTRIWMKGLMRVWCAIASWILGIKSYLLGTEPHPANDVPPNRQQPAAAGEGGAQQGGLGAAHHALLQRDMQIGFQPYERPTFFALRLIGLMALMCLSLVVASLLIVTVPIWIGRNCLTTWYSTVPQSTFSGIPELLSATATTATSIAAAVAQETADIAVDPTATASSLVALTASDPITAKPHELYTVAIGTYICWLISRGIAIGFHIFPQGRQAIVLKIKNWISIISSYGMAATIFFILLGVIPLLFGLLIEVVLIIPLRIPIEQTPIIFLWQDWALGVLYTKIAVALTLMGPDLPLKRAIERVYRDGLRDLDLTFIIRELAAPLITSFGLSLSVPYVLAHSILPIFFKCPHARLFIERRIYPFFLIVAIIIGIVLLQIRQFKKLYVAIKNDKYLVGQRLVNYDHRKKKMEKAAAAAAAAAAASSSSASATASNNVPSTNTNNNNNNNNDETSAAATQIDGSGITAANIQSGDLLDGKQNVINDINISDSNDDDDGSGSSSGNRYTSTDILNDCATVSN